MPKLLTPHSPSRPYGSERVFTDDHGRLWSAALDERDDPDSALVFRCISDGRESIRALAVDTLVLRDTRDDALRVWLGKAPRIGLLS